MNRERLERLAANPHYQMTPQQVKQLRRLRERAGQPSQPFPKHDPDFQKHNPLFKRTDNGSAD